MLALKFYYRQAEYASIKLSQAISHVSWLKVNKAIVLRSTSVIILRELKWLGIQCVTDTPARSRYAGLELVSTAPFSARSVCVHFPYAEGPSDPSGLLLTTSKIDSFALFYLNCKHDVQVDTVEA
jgi:hypothetical protein